MHMSDALISPVVGLPAIGLAISVGAYSIKKIRISENENLVPLMGVMGAFIFSVQMINFAIPGTGSSGHLLGALLLSIMLGPYAAFLTMAAVIFVQAFIFGDGGILAYGCNVMNMAFFACFIGYPLIYKPIVKAGATKLRVFIACIVAALISIELGAFCAVIETMLSGKTDLPFSVFLVLMLSIHLAIAIVEGLVTACIAIFLSREKPELIYEGKESKAVTKKLTMIFLVAAIIIGGVLSVFASTKPDGLEWSLANSATYSDTTSPLENESQGKSLLTYSNASIAGLLGVGITLVGILAVGSGVTRVRKKKPRVGRIQNALNLMRSIDDYKGTSSLLSRFDARLKLIVCFIIILILATYGKYQVWVLFQYIFIAFVLLLVSKIPFSFFAKRLLSLEPFLVIISLFAALFSSNIYLGTELFLTCLIKANLTIFLVLMYIATTGSNEMFEALSHLKVPQVFIDVLTLLYRYLWILFEETEMVLTAHNLRNGGRKGIGFSAWGSLVGQLFLRTYERGNEIYTSMCLRGYRIKIESKVISHKKISCSQYVVFILILLAIVSLRFLNLPIFLGGLFVGK